MAGTERGKDAVKHLENHKYPIIKGEPQQLI